MTPLFSFLLLVPLSALQSCPDPGSITYLEGLAKAVVEEARVRPGQRVPGGPAPENTTGVTLIQPGGRSAYPSYWIRDFAMSLDCGYVTADEMLAALRLTAQVQNADHEKRLQSGGRVPPYAIPDHVRFDGKPVFYPGTYSAGEDQGADPWGPLPPADDHFYFVHIAFDLWKATGDKAFLSQLVGGMTIREHLERAYAAPEVDGATGAVVCRPSTRCVGFGFDDSVYMTGAMAFATLLRFQAARELAELVGEAGRHSLRSPSSYRKEARKIGSHFVELFGGRNAVQGWCRASTGISGQADVWATLFALHLGVLPRDAATKARFAIAQALRAGTIEYRGAVRHVPTNLDARPDSAWDRSVAALNQYQNGGYWHTPTGWLVEALWKSDKALACAVLARYLAYLQERDFRKGGDAPVECLGPNDGGWSQNACYMTSITVPVAVLRTLR
jgi:hypothetical protein